MMNQLCLDCEAPLAQLIYAVYKPAKGNSEGENEMVVVGYLCEACRKKHKVKSLRQSREHLKALEQLKNQLSQKQ